MIVYNTTFHIDPEILEECLKFIRTVYIPRATGRGFLQAPALRRIMVEEEDMKNRSYAIQFHVENVEMLQYWLDNEGVALQQELLQRFGHKVAGFATLLEEMSLKDE